MFSAYLSASACLTFSGTPALTGPYAVPIPISTDQARFALRVETAIASYFEPVECSVEGPSISYVGATGSLPFPSTTSIFFSPIAISLSGHQTVSTTTTTSTITSQLVISPPSVTPSFTSPPSHLPREAKIGIGIGISLGAIALITLFISLLTRYRQRHSKSQKQDTRKAKTRIGWRAYFQNKGELDAEEQSKHEAEKFGSTARSRR